VVGCVAAAVHWTTVMALVRQGIAPLVANPLGWVVAFGVSWAGHHRLTFAQQGAPARRTLPRFVAISFVGFLANEAAYAALLHVTGLGYGVALAIVLAGIAVLTWIASRHWAFSGNHPRAPGPQASGATAPREPSG
jgi:putative flippase GtrA